MTNRRENFKLVMIRHGESEWNSRNLFTGWTDVGLTEKGRKEAVRAGRRLKRRGIDFDICHTSYLKRAIDTLDIVLAEMDRQWLPVVKDWRLNERHYGALQGLNKRETAEKYGEEQVRLWRRSYDVRPPALIESDPRNSRSAAAYRNEPPDLIPLTESLADTVLRVAPYYHRAIEPDLRAGKRVLLAIHGNTIRALLKYLGGISNEDIVKVEIPTGEPLEYDFSPDLSPLGRQPAGV